MTCLRGESIFEHYRNGWAVLESNYVLSGPFVIHVLDLSHDVLNVVYVVETKRNAASSECGLGGEAGSLLKYTKPPLLICGDRLVIYHINIVN